MRVVQNLELLLKESESALGHPRFHLEPSSGRLTWFGGRIGEDREMKGGAIRGPRCLEGRIYACVDSVPKALEGTTRIHG